MSGFLVQSFSAPVLPSSPIKLVDLGESEITDSFVLGNVRAAWTYWRTSKQWKIERTRDRLLLIEGQPDRFPNPGESLEYWLQGRYGSFRGFEISADGTGRAMLRVFTDPLCTRPVYYLQANDNVTISDKLATVVLNAGECEPDWGSLLENALLGSLYSYKTTVKNAVWMEPGEALEFDGPQLKRRWKNPLPQDPSLSEAEVLKHPTETLRLAIEKAIHETWTDPEMRLLLSGGLDSRILLMLASGKRKTLNQELHPGETKIAEQVAAAAGCEFQMMPPPDYEFRMRWAYLVTGAMHDSKFVIHLGQLPQWRAQGVTGLTHGYFHNTMYRGWTAARYERHPYQNSILFELMGRNAFYFDRYACKQSPFQRQFHDVLSDEGKQLLRLQLRELGESLKPVIIDGYDLTFERRLMDFVPRQVYFSCLLSWYEALDVASPVFQPSLWTWYELSRPRHRDRDWAIRELYLTLDHPAAKVPDSNTGAPVTHLQSNWRDSVRNQFWYPSLRNTYLKMFAKPVPYQQGGLQWGKRFREPAILALLEEGIANIADHPLLDRTRTETALRAFRDGDIDLVDSIGALATIGQWQRLMRQSQSQTEHVRTVHLDSEERDLSAQVHSSGERARA